MRDQNILDMRDSHKVLMIGWEYPPHNSGGLGIACQGITQSLADQNTEIYFTLPYQLPTQIGHMQVVNCYDKKWDTPKNKPPFMAYGKAAPTGIVKKKKIDASELYALPTSEMEQKVEDYTQTVEKQSKTLKHQYDVIHAHDWMSFPAAINLKKKTGKPLISHVHSTEYDRIPSGDVSPYIANTEYNGMKFADRVIAVSYYTKQILTDKYKIDPEKIDVVHNGITAPLHTPDPGEHHFAHSRPIVVFMGRLTSQKGAHYFLHLASEIVHQVPEALFIVAGNGDMYHELLLTTAKKGLSASVVFSGFVRSKQKAKLLDRADVFVMPSLSEPFGLVALEAAQRHTPVIVSKNSGVTEVLPGSIAVDFWDVQKMTQTVVGLLDDAGFHHNVTQSQLQDLNHITWDNSAKKIRGVYRSAFLGQ